MTATDPRVRQLAESVHGLAREKATSLPAWGELPLSEREKVTTEARLWLRAAVDAGLVPAVVSSPPATDRATVLREAADALEAKFEGASRATIELRRMADEAQPADGYQLDDEYGIDVDEDGRPFARVLFAFQPSVPGGKRLALVHGITEAVDGARFGAEADVAQQPEADAVERVARRLAGAWITDADWGRYPERFREEYRTYAREVIALAGPDTETPACPDPIECSHEAALGQAKAAIKRVVDWTATLDAVAVEVHGPGTRHPVADHIRELLDTTAVGGAGGVADETGEGGDRLVAHVLATGTDLHCLRCAPPPYGDIWTPVIADELEDGGVCVRCGVDVLIPQEADRG